MPLIESLAPAHLMFDARAVHYGHRYRSGFWAIYLLSAVAVLFAVLPLALGWDDRRHLMHPLLGLWALAEVVVIGTVSAIYWLGHRRDWQGQWLRARTAAELIWYLPLVAPLIDFSQPEPSANWYMRVFDPGNHLRSGDELEAICSKNESLAKTLLDGAWADPQFVVEICPLDHGHSRGAGALSPSSRHQAARTAAPGPLFEYRPVRADRFWCAAASAVHTVWLSLLTTFFPALGASLHGALAQSEAYRLGSTSERLWGELQRAIGTIRTALAPQGLVPEAEAIKTSILEAIELILEEHQDWHMLVRPHHLPLA